MSDSPTTQHEIATHERVRGDIPILSIVIPAYNEEAWIARLLDRLVAVQLRCRREIIVVDDGSTDGTQAAVEPFLEDGHVRFVKLAKNSGKGSALRAGFALAVGDFVLVQDADEEYDPRDIPAIIEPLLEGRAKAVYGSRVINEHCRGHRRHTNPFWWGGRSLTVLSNLLFWKCRISDEPVCYKALRMDLLRTIPLRCTGFEFCPELTAKLSRRGIAIYNVPIRYSPRSVATGKKIRSKHFFEAVWTLMRYRIFSDHGPIADFQPDAPELEFDSGEQSPTPPSLMPLHFLG